MEDKCKECGCVCSQCNRDEKLRLEDMHLHAEIESLRQRLYERDSHIVTMETQFLNEAEKFPNGELASLKEEVHIWQDKYTRLHEAHKRIQRVNQNLEDKLLKIVDKCETEKGAFTKDIATLSHRLAEANYTIHRLTLDNEKYRNDVSLAIQLLQNKPANYVGQKFDSLPPDIQAKVKSYLPPKLSNVELPPPIVKSITVPISTFPPTAMVYNVTKPPSAEKPAEDINDEDSKTQIDVVSAAILAKILEDREKERIFARHCHTCSCYKTVLKIDSETQTECVEKPNSLDKIKNTVNMELQSPKPLCSPMDNLKLENNIDYDKQNLKNNSSLVYMSKYERKSSKDLKNLKSSSNTEEEIKNSQNFLSAKNNEASLDVINDRVWRNNKSNQQQSNLASVIELKNSENSSLKNESSGIGTDLSDPSSVSSDVTAPVANGKPVVAKKLTGPRTCLMRVTPGSKNILLDSAGNFESVLYTSSSSKPNTALVHARKNSHPERSPSVSSEENSQLQRVAEWVDSNNQNNNNSLAEKKDEDLMVFEISSDEEHKFLSNGEKSIQVNSNEELSDKLLPDSDKTKKVRKSHTKLKSTA